MKKKHTSSKLVIGVLGATAAFIVSTNAIALPYYYTDWETWNPAAGTATGTITPSSGPDVTVTF